MWNVGKQRGVLGGNEDAEGLLAVTSRKIVIWLVRFARFRVLRLLCVLISPLEPLSIYLYTTYNTAG